MTQLTDPDKGITQETDEKLESLAHETQATDAENVSAQASALVNAGEDEEECQV